MKPQHILYLTFLGLAFYAVFLWGDWHGQRYAYDPKQIMASKPYQSCIDTIKRVGLVNESFRQQMAKSGIKATYPK